VIVTRVWQNSKHGGRFMKQQQCRCEERTIVSSAINIAKVRRFTKGYCMRPHARLYVEYFNSRVMNHASVCACFLTIFHPVHDGYVAKAG